MFKKTVTTFLLSDDPDAIKSIWVANRVCNCIYLTRNDLKLAKDREELHQPALYFLLGEENKVYIGETENFNQRIIDHNNKKDFWNESLVFIAKDNSLSKSEVRYLECLAISKVEEFRNFTLEGNKQSPNYPSLEENKIEIIQEFFEEVVYLSRFLKFDLFELPKKENPIFWYCSNKRGTEAKAIYEGTKVIVLEGSRICKDYVKSCPKIEERKLLLSRSAKEEQDYFVLIKKVSFLSPSSASAFCLGNSSNGWIDWKNKNGKTISEVLRKNE